MPEHLRREGIILELEIIPAGSKKIGQIETKQLESISAELYVKKCIRPKYLLSTTANANSAEVIVADIPVQPIDNFIARPGLLS